MGGWQNSDRRSHLPSNWRALREQRFRMDGYRCTAIDPNTDERCPEPAEECDHIGRRDDHRIHMLRSLCSWHHGQKTGRQGAAASNAARRSHHKKFRRTDDHPGLL